MNDADDYLGKMPFFIVFLDPLHTDFHSSGKPLNEYIARHPLMHDKLHRPAFAAKVLEMAANSSNMRVFVRKADALIKHPLHYIVRNGVFRTEEQMWAFINSPENIAAVKTHGIGTADSDAAELAALETVFGTLPPLMAFKAQIGHTLGATAALETALLLSALKQGGGTDYQGREIRFSECAASWRDDLFCLANHFGFGGSNTAMVWQWKS